MRAADRPEKLPNFLAQETSGMHEYLSMLFRLYSYKQGDSAVSADGAVSTDGAGAQVESSGVDGGEWDRCALAEERIRELCEMLVADFVAKEAVVSSTRNAWICIHHAAMDSLYIHIGAYVCMMPLCDAIV